MLTAEKSYRKVREQAEVIKNDSHHTVETMSVHDAWAQGDLAIIYLGDSLPDGVVKTDTPVAQLAPGNTQGSRHCIESLGDVTLYARRNATVLDGPIIDAPGGLRVNHPEHGDVTIKQGGVYAIRYQRAFADELSRIQD